jgi:subtilisin family serine protease
MVKLAYFSASLLPEGSVLVSNVAVIIRLTVLWLLALWLVAAAARDEPSPLLKAEASVISPAVSGEILVRLESHFASLPDSVLARLLKGEIAGRLPELDAVTLRLTNDETPAEAVQRLGRSHYVVYAEPNLILRSAMIPTDPYFTAQGAYLNLVEATQAWDIEQGRDTVLVAVLDSGIDVEHPDLKAKIWTNVRETANNEIDDDDNGCIDDVHGCSFVTAATVDAACTKPSSGVVDDDNGHGTFVSGIIAAQGNNGMGIIGVAPGVTILPVKTLDCTGGGAAAQAAQALLYAARVGARVANISFSADGGSMTLTNAIREARDKYGMVIVAPTGNSGHRGVRFPARLPETLAVASSGTPSDQFERSPYSDWGPEVAVAAPGLNVVSTVPAKYCEAWRCADGQPYAIASGTSFAAPMVSALAALLISRTPNLSPDAVERIITSSALPLPDGDTPNWAGAGRIRMRAALSQRRFTLGVAGVSKY